MFVIRSLELNSETLDKKRDLLMQRVFKMRIFQIVIPVNV